MRNPVLHPKITSILFIVLFSQTLSAAEGLPELTQEELENYEFEIEDSQVTVKDLTLGQRYVLSTQRRELGDLVARRLATA